jgi:hypothetical protein
MYSETNQRRLVGGLSRERKKKKKEKLNTCEADEESFAPQPMYLYSSAIVSRAKSDQP